MAHTQTVTQQSLPQGVPAPAVIKSSTLRHTIRHSYAMHLLEGIRNSEKINNKGTLFVLTGRHTGSAATVFCVQLKISTQAVFIGEVSRSNPNLTYNAERFQLPKSKLWAGYSESFHHPFPELGKTLTVDVPLENSFEDYKTGNDRFLEFVWSYSKR